MASDRKGARVERLTRKLDALLEKGDKYEAHQLYKTIYFRYTTNNQHGEAARLAFDGASYFLSQESSACGTSGEELACMFVQAHDDGHLPLDDAVLERIKKLLQLLGPGESRRETFVRRAVDWSKSCSAEHAKFGHPRLHRVVAISCWQFKDFAAARWHFLHADSAEECAAMLVEFSCSKGERSEVDLYITQSVLHLLVLKKIQQAKMVFERYVSAHPDVEKQRPPFLLPLMNFLWFLMSAAEQKLVQAFKVLRDKYSPSLARDPTYGKCLDRIGELLFGLPSKPGVGGAGGGLEDLFKSFTSSMGATGTAAAAVSAVPIHEEDVD